MMLKKVYDRYTALSLPVKMSLWYLLCSVLQKGIGMLSTPVFTRIMTEAEYGRYSVFNSWSGIFSALISLNIAGGFYMRGLVMNEKDRDTFTSSLVGLTGFLCCIAAVLYLLFHSAVDRFTGLNTILSILILGQIFLRNTRDFWINRHRVDYNFKPIVALTVVTAILSPVLSMVFVRNADSVHQVEGRACAVALVEAGFFTGLFLSVWKSGKKLVQWNYWKEAIVFSLPLIPHYLSKIVLNQSDRLMIGSFCGFTEAGYYSVAYSIAALFMILNQAVAASLDPWLYRCIRDKSFGSIRRISMNVLRMMGILNLAVIAVAPEILRLFAPSNFYAAVWIIPPVTASVFFMFLYDLFSAFQYYFAKTRWVMYASLAGAALNVILNWIFIPRFGFLAAGYTTLICYVLFGLGHYYFMCKVCDTYLECVRPYQLKEVMGTGATLLLGAAAMTVCYPHPVIRYAIIAAVLILALLKREQLTELFRAVKQKR